MGAHDLNLARLYRALTDSERACRQAMLRVTAVKQLIEPALIGEAGGQAHLEGKPFTANPYAPDEPNWQHWDRGWRAAAVKPRGRPKGSPNKAQMELPGTRAARTAAERDHALLPEEPDPPPMPAVAKRQVGRPPGSKGHHLADTVARRLRAMAAD